MRNKILWATIPVIIGVVAIFLSACNKNYVALEYTNAKGEVPQLGNLTFRFNKSLYPDSLLNAWDSTEYISFEPEIHGRFRWDGPDQLVFSPAEPLQPATTYKAKLHDEILRYSKYNDIKEDGLEFHTANLSLNDAQVSWILLDEGSKAIAPQVLLQFNYPVKTEDLQEHLKVEVDGAKREFAVQNIGATNEVALRINGFKAEDKNYEAQVTIGKGLKPEKGQNSTKEDTKTQLSIPSPYVLNVNNVQSEHDGTEGTVRIFTSQQLTGENITNYVKFEPAVSYTTEFTDGGVILRSDKFDLERSYSLNIEKGLRGKIGGVLKEEYSDGVAFGELEADVKFTNSKAVYLSKKGGGNIEVRISNVPKVKLVISKIYENNLLMAERYGYYPKDNDDSYREDYGEDYEYASYTDAVAGDVIYSKEIDVASLKKSGNGRILNISQFEDRLPDAKGIYHVMIRSTQDYWVRDSRFISFSDIGLIAKQGAGKFFVFANSIKSANPINGVTVNIYGNNNQLLGTGATNEDGAAEINVPAKDMAGFKPAMIIARTADDFTYLPFSNTRVNTSRFDVGGKKINPTGLDAFIYAERDIYRPGEKVNFSVLVRDRKWKSPGELPVKMKFLLPNGKELKSFRKSLNDQGATEGSIDISSAAITGSYLLEVYSSNDVLLASKNFMIEEFVPDRIKVTAKSAKTVLRPSEATQVTINAVNFFGPPAVNRNYEVDVKVRQEQFSSKKYAGYDFSLANQQSFMDEDVRQGKTDAEGNAVESYEVPSIYTNSGLLKVNFYTTVFDETGRPVSRKASADIYTQDVFHGIKDDGFYYYALNQPVKFGLVSLNKDGVPVNATAKVQVIKHEYKTVLAKSGSYLRYQSQEVDKMIVDGQMAIGANTTYAFTPRTPGNYEIRIYRPGANAYVSKMFYSYGGWGADASSFEVNTEGHIDIEVDKEEYASGDNAKLLFKTPFSGRMLVTFETDGIKSYQYVDVSNRSASLDVKLNGEHVPNVYVTATLIKPHEVSDIPLTVAHGFQSIKVEEKNRRIAVEITAQKSVRSKTHQTVKVRAAPGSYVTLAAVDNGVLQVSDFKTPDPYNYYYQKQALGVHAFDMYPLLFPELRARMSSTGGDGDLNMDKRVNPMPAKRFKLMSYWSGIKKANGSGVAEFEFDIPQFNGEVRLMAVAYKDERFGSAESNMKVADPIVLSSALPRFLSPGDTVQVPVTISNTTAKAASGQASINVGGPVKILGAASQNVNINPNSEARVLFNVVADPSINVANIAINVNALGEKFTDATEIAVRPPSTLQKTSGSGSIVGGNTQRITIPTSDYIQGSFRYNIVVSKSPVAEITDQLRYLVQYPYGCTEQTVSAAFPQLYFGDFVDMLGIQNAAKANSAYNVIEAIRKIKMRQLYNGAVMLWDGEGSEDWWTTVYAAHFLLEARKAGFDVDNSLIETMLGYISNRLKTKETITYYYNRDQNRKIAPKEVAYSLYVLALANRSNVSAMNYYKAKPELLALDGKYLLSAAYAVSGDKRSFNTLLPRAFSGEESVQQTGGSFYSVTRDEAIALNALMDVDPGNAQVPEMARHVSQRLKSERYLNTQERAFSFLALGKIARRSANSNATAEIKVNGKTVGKVDGKEWKGSSEELKSNNIEIVTKGSGRLYYSWQAEGISASGNYVQEDNYIKVRRQFYDRNGREISGNVFKQNDLIIIGITLEKAYSNTVENIVITDLLPAGFEIENPRTKELPGMDWAKDVREPTALDVRDDRIHFFVDARDNKQKYYYAVRAVSLGQFKQGSISADAMYNGEIHSYYGAGVIKVIQ
jgi:alpha-2-macroglobulin